MRLCRRRASRCTKPSNASESRTMSPVIEKTSTCMARNAIVRRAPLLRASSSARNSSLSYSTSRRASHQYRSGTSVRAKVNLLALLFTPRFTLSEGAGIPYPPSVRGKHSSRYRTVSMGDAEPDTRYRACVCKKLGRDILVTQIPPIILQGIINILACLAIRVADVLARKMSPEAERSRRCLTPSLFSASHLPQRLITISIEHERSGTIERYHRSRSCLAVSLYLFPHGTPVFEPARHATQYSDWFARISPLADSNFPK